MGQVDKLNESIEELRDYLNDLVERDEKGSELLLASKRLDKLLVEYYISMKKCNSGE